MSRFKMTISDVFSISGKGAVGAGRVETGVVRSNDTIEVVNSSGVKRVRVTSIESFKGFLDEASPRAEALAFAWRARPGKTSKGDTSGVWKVSVIRWASSELIARSAA